LDTARNLYLASRIRQQVKYCFIFFHQVLRTDFSRLIEEHFKNTNYQTVLGGRPLIYLFNDDYTDDDFRCFRAQALAVDLPNPYFVRMGYQPSMADRSFAEVDAVSEYAFPQTCGDPYPTLAQREEQHWEAVKSAGLHLIPSVSTGWDARPRIINPVTWYKYQSDSWCQQATPSEIAGHLRMALEWAQANPNTVDAGAIIIYAWNEFDEGGWICPTLFGGTDRLGAIRRVLVDEASDEGRNS